MDSPSDSDLPSGSPSPGAGPRPVPPPRGAGQGITVAALVADSALSAGKIIAGFLCSSQAILADGLHSGSDLITDVAVLAGLRIAEKPADRSHPYGHRRVSTLVAMFVAAGLIFAAGSVALGAVKALEEGQRTVHPVAPFLLAAATIPIKELLFRLTRRAAKKDKNPALLANAWHHRTDAYSSIGAAVGLAGVLVGGASWQFLDSVTALLLAVFLVVVAVRIMSSSASELIDRAPDEASQQNIREIVRNTPGVRGHHAFRARHLAGKIEMDVHIQVDPNLTVQAGHEIASQVKRKIMDSDPSVVEAIIHIEPASQQ